MAIVEPSSGTLPDTPAPEAPRANQHASDASGRGSADLLQVGVPAPLRLVIGMADVVADRRAFAANRTMSHRGNLSSLVRSAASQACVTLQISRARVTMKEGRTVRPRIDSNWLFRYLIIGWRPLAL